MLLPTSLPSDDEHEKYFTLDHRIHKERERRDSFGWIEFSTEQIFNPFSSHADARAV